MSDFRRLLVEEIPRLRRFATALARDRTKADDLVQDTLVRALLKSDGFQMGTNLRAWLFTIMRNLYISEVRRYAARPQLHVVDEETGADPVPASQTDFLSLKELEAAIAVLPEAQRSTLLLVGLEGLSYEEAATVTGVAVGTVRSRLARAREALRLGLEDKDSGAGEAESKREQRNVSGQ